MDSTKESVSDFVECKRLIALVDLAGFTKAFHSQSDLEMASFLQEYYAACEEVLGGSGGTVVKFMGDSCLAVFPPSEAPQCAEAVVELRARVEILGVKYGIAISLGANLHIADVVEGDFGAGANRRADIVGRGVNQTFLLGGGPDIRVSEPVYRALPSEMRGPWRKHKPPSIYVLDRTDGANEGKGKYPSANLQRW